MKINCSTLVKRLTNMYTLTKELRIEVMQHNHLSSWSRFQGPHIWHCIHWRRFLRLIIYKCGFVRHQSMEYYILVKLHIYPFAHLKLKVGVTKRVRFIGQTRFPALYCRVGQRFRSLPFNVIVPSCPIFFGHVN